jgi:hypothetical protein
LNELRLYATNLLLSEHETIVWLASVDGHRQAKAEATFIAILVGTLGSVHSGMQVKVSRSLAAPIYVIVMLLALSSSLAVKAHTPDEPWNLRFNYYLRFLGLDTTRLFMETANPFGDARHYGNRATRDSKPIAVASVQRRVKRRRHLDTTQ